jgi:2-isopropylmalate synthase
LEVSKILEEMKIDIKEIGFAAASERKFNTVKTVTKEIKNSVLATLCRTVSKDIDLGWEAVKYALNPRIHLLRVIKVALD